ncbi:POPLD (NUC188) domain containing protein [Amanita muscaria]
MAPKRKDDTTNDAQTAREKKKQKVAFARTIAVQDPPSASAGPSTFTSLGRLPSAIDVEKFAEVRAFEIGAMEDAMKNASASSTHRVWQTLPRHLRRRAASHDVRRVPTRLREKAHAEMGTVKKPSKPRKPQRGKANRPTREETLLKRQRDKLWLESHLWHAKRMKMENMWGYRLAVHPTEKAYRSSHRASVHGSIIHDASYCSIIEVTGAQRIIESMLKLVCDPQAEHPAAKRNTIGSRVIHTHLYKPDTYPFDLLMPVTILWQPMCAQETDPEEGGQLHQDPKDVVRHVWLICHPASYDDAFALIQQATSLALAAAKRQQATANTEYEMEIADLRGHFNIFEIMGPKSNQVLKGALKPVSQDAPESFIQFWSALNKLPCSGSLPRNMVVGFTVIDPRLDFPPNNARVGSETTCNLVTVPSDHLAQSEIWDEPVRLNLRKPRYKKSELDHRRSMNDVPGTRLQPQRLDDRVPVLLIQHSLESSLADSQALHGWRLIFPAGWSMAFLNSLVYTGSRVGGQRERQTQAYEAGTAYYPRDYPFTQAYATYARDREKEERERWTRKPPAKRVNYRKLGIRSPFRPDWEVVLGLPELLENPDADAEFVSTQRDDSMGVSQDDNPVQPWLLQGPLTQLIFSSASDMFNRSAGLLAEVNTLRRNFNLDPLASSISGADLLKGALVLVAINMCNRGTPEDLDSIHIMDDEETARWITIMRKNRNRTMMSEPEDRSSEELEVAGKKPLPASIIGYVTTGHYSLSRSKGYGIGVVSLSRMLELKAQITRCQTLQKITPLRLTC